MYTFTKRKSESKYSTVFFFLVFSFCCTLGVSLTEDNVTSFITRGPTAVIMFCMCRERWMNALLKIFDNYQSMLLYRYLFSCLAILLFRGIHSKKYLFRWAFLRWRKTNFNFDLCVELESFSWTISFYHSFNLSLNSILSDKNSWRRRLTKNMLMYAFFPDNRGLLKVLQICF